MQRVAISGSGLHTAPHIISNEELVNSYNAHARHFNEVNAQRIAAGEIAAREESSVDFIEKASGISRRYVMDKEGVLDPQRMRPCFVPRRNDELSLQAEIAVDAGRQALAAAGRNPADIDAVICAASNMQRPYPAMTVEIQHALGIHQGYAFDMNVACSSATFALDIALNAVRCGSARRVLVVDPEICSAHLAWQDRDCHFIFGDVCTAIVVEGLPPEPTANSWEILGSRLATSFSNNIRNNAGFMSRSEDRNPGDRDQLFYQEGRKVFKEVCPMAAEHISRHLDARPAASAGAPLLVAPGQSGDEPVDRPPPARPCGDCRRSTGDPRRVRQHRLGRLDHRFHRHNADLARGDLGEVVKKSSRAGRDARRDGANDETYQVDRRGVSD
jgi:beta-ketodecanoyl-[acyl-carrier-protein] synthase